MVWNLRSVNGFFFFLSFVQGEFYFLGGKWPDFPRWELERNDFRSRVNVIVFPAVASFNRGQGRSILPLTFFFVGFQAPKDLYFLSIALDYSGVIWSRRSSNVSWCAVFCSVGDLASRATTELCRVTWCVCSCGVGSPEFVLELSPSRGASSPQMISWSSRG